MWANMRATVMARLPLPVANPRDLAGYRNDQVFIANPTHVPIPKEAVRDGMPVLFERLEQEPHAGVRAVLGHLVFV